MTFATTSTDSAARSPLSPARSTRALLTKDTITWRQATEGWAVLTALGTFAVAAGLLFKIAQILRHQK